MWLYFLEVQKVNSVTEQTSLVQALRNELDEPCLADSVVPIHFENLMAAVFKDAFHKQMEFFLPAKVWATMLPHVWLTQNSSLIVDISIFDFVFFIEVFSYLVE